MQAVKKAIPGDVYQFGKNAAVPDWFAKALSDRRIVTYTNDEANPFSKSEEVEVITLEGVMHGNKGDYVLHGKNDDIWVVREDIFNDTYEVIK